MSAVGVSTLVGKLNGRISVRFALAPTLLCTFARPTNHLWHRRSLSHGNGLLHEDHHPRCRHEIHESRVV